MSKKKPKLLILSHVAPQREWMGESIEEARNVSDIIFNHYPKVTKVEIIDTNTWRLVEKHIAPKERINEEENRK